MKIGNWLAFEKISEPVYVPPTAVAVNVANNGYNRYNYHNDRRLVRYAVETIGTCIRVRAAARSQSRYKATVNGREHRAAQQLLDRPNPLFTPQQFFEWVSGSLDLCGNSIWAKQRGAYGQTMALWPLPGKAFDIDRCGGLTPKFYKWFDGATVIPASEIVHIKTLSAAKDIYVGRGILEEIETTAEIAEAIRLFQRRYFDEDAITTVGFEFPTGSTVTDTQIENIQKTWMSKYSAKIGPMRVSFERGGEVEPPAGSRLQPRPPAVLPDGGKFVNLTPQPKEIDFATTKKDVRDSIRESFQVPKILVGDTEDVNLNNARSSIDVFLQFVVDNFHTNLSGSLESELRREFGDSLRLVVEGGDSTDSPELYIEKLKLFKDDLTPDERRDLVGFQPSTNAVVSV
jgi:phage portal protein BeeE